MQEPSKIRGVGAKKSDDFAEIFLAEIGKHMKEYRLSSRENNQETKRKVRRDVTRQDSRYGKTKQMVSNKCSLTQMAEEHGFTQGTIINHLEKLLNAGERLSYDYLRPPEDHFQNIQKAITVCGDTRLKPIYDFLQGQHSYDEIRLVLLLAKAS